MLRAKLQGELKKRFSRVASKRGSLVLALQSEVGGGKTWLAERLLTELPCRNTTFSATISSAELARKLPRPERLPGWVEQLLGRLVQGEPVEPQAIADALSALLVALAPFVLHLEDWHEASQPLPGSAYAPPQVSSQSSANLWLKLATALRYTRGVGLLITGRTAPPAPVEVLRLEPLSSDETRTLLEAEMQNTLPPGALAWIYSRAQGNPLFSLEYVRFLAKRGFLWSDGRHWHWRTPEDEATPTTVEALIARTLQLAAPSPTLQTALGAKALLPTGSPDQLWAGVSDLDSEALQNAKTHLAEQGLLLAGEFTHSLVREVARRELTAETRLTFARRAVRLLEREQPDVAATFVEQAGLGRDYTRDLLLRAVARARDGNKGRLATLLTRAATYASVHEQAELTLEASQLLRHTDVVEAARLTKLVLAAAPDHLEATFLRAHLLAQLGLNVEAEGLLLSLPEAVQRQADWVRAAIDVRVSVHDYTGVLAIWDERSAVQATADPETRAQVGRALIQLGRFAEAETFLERALDAGDLGGLAHALLQSTHALLPLIQGDFGAAVRRYDLALTILAEDHLAANLVQLRRGEVLWMRSLALYRWGRYPEAIADLETYLNLVSAQGNGLRYAEGQVNLGTYLVEVGEFERAEDVLLESRGVLERNQNIRWLTVVEQQLVQLYLDWAPPHGSALALKHAQAAESYARRTLSPPHLAEALCFVSRAEAVHGRPQHALQLVDELQQFATTLGEARLETYSRWVRGLALEKLGQEQAALGELEHAVERMTSLGHEAFAQRLALEIDRIRGDAQTAATRIRHFERIGNLNWANIATRYFPQLAAAPAPREALPTLHFSVLGPLQFMRGGGLLAFSSHQGKVLLALLLEARLSGRSGVEQLELLDTLYPDLDETRAASALKQLIYRLRSALGTAAIVRTSRGYALGAVSSDAEAFLESGDTRLWRGPYLEDLEAWASNARDALYHAVQRRATEHLQTEPDEAARLGKLLLEADAYDTEALTVCLRALASVGDTRGLERLYRRSRDHFSEVGEALPDSWETFLRASHPP